MSDTERLNEIASELDTLALKMRSTAAKMLEWGSPLNGALYVSLGIRGTELNGASNLAREWAKEIRKDAKQWQVH